MGYPLPRVFLQEGPDSRNSGHLCGPGRPWAAWKLLWSSRPGWEATLSFPINIHAPLLSRSRASWMGRALGDSHFLLLILACSHAGALVCMEWGGCRWLKGLSPKLTKGLVESSREQPDLRRVRRVAPKIHNP